MSLFTVLGATIIDHEFRERFFSNPIKAANRYLWPVSMEEKEFLNKLSELGAEEITQLKDCMAAIEKILCKKWPCKDI